MQFTSISRQGSALVGLLSLSLLVACGESTSNNADENTQTENLVCGDSIVGGEEACDGGGTETADCDADCTEVVCGDSVVNAAAGETCDDGNTELEACEYGESSCIVCGPGCTEVAGQVLYCGNGTVEGDEVCDEAGDTSACDSDCTEADCGDGYLNGSADEACDDGNTVTEICDYGLTSCEVCNFLCQYQSGNARYCGDGEIDYSYGESCDDEGQSETCDDDCTMVECGDGVHNIAAGELCDAGEALTDTCDYGLTECEVCTQACEVIPGLTTYCGDDVLDTDHEFCEQGETTTMLCTAFDPQNFESGIVTCGNDCMADTTGCVEIPRDAQYEACTEAGLSPFVQGSCEADLYCLPLTTDTTGFCMLPCDGAGDTQTCGEDVCYENPAGWFCYRDDALRDEPCRDNLNMCAPGEGECIDRVWDQATSTHIDPRCTITCDSVDIGQQGTCPDEETCFTNTGGYADVAGDTTGQPLACEEETDCPVGFDCLQFSNGDNYCARMQGWCGDAVPVCGAIDNYDWYNCLYDADMQCSLSEGHDYCAVQGATGAEATPQCIDVGLSSGVCLAFCEGPDEEDLDCGTGYECVVPGEGQWAYMWRLEEPNVYCDPATDGIASTSVCGDTYQCMTFTMGSLCGRPLKHCQEIRPVVDSVEPAIGSVSGGTAITIRGENFKEGSVVLIGNMYASEVTWVSSSEMTAIAPSRSPGLSDVTVRSETWQEGTLSLGFEFAVDPPVLYSLSPDHGPEEGGTQIVIEGGNFPSNPIVTFGGIAGTAITVYNNVYPTGWRTIWVTTPPGTGVVDLQIENPNTVYLADEDSVPYVVGEFTYDVPEVDPTDAADASDAADPSDSSDAADASDAADPSDSSDAADTTDPSDGSDAADVSDATDPSDSSDAADASDAADTADPSGT
ncbi:MAG: IPT/TIG domain-containing protein [Deltaproteobacteria bacterium]|nr:IPT/TIG domain-containing protein [Deltaproteobacteria bacterium]